jgi:uncharacterized protein YbjT (DUF2867 family)
VNWTICNLLWRSEQSLSTENSVIKIEPKTANRGKTTEDSAKRGSSKKELSLSAALPETDARSDCEKGTLRMSIAITAPTGNIGKRLVSLLLEAGADLTLLVRHPDKLEPAVRDRVKVQQGDQLDADFVRRALAGAEALFWLTPGDPQAADLHASYDRFGASVAEAVRENSIAHVVNLSSVGAQLPHAGPVSGLGQVERHLNTTDAAVVHLRPGYFMENTLMQLEALRHQNSMFAPAPGDIPFPQIATRDIATAAAPLLLKRDWAGKSIHGLHGPEDLTFNQVAGILSEVTGRPIRYVTITPEEARAALLGMGIGAAFAQGYLDMYASLAQPGAVAEPRTPQTTTPTTLREWAQDVLLPLLSQ